MSPRRAWRAVFSVRALAILELILLAAVILRTAWVSDDAFITFRTVENALNGHGFRWNVAERVQSYTHPLWMLLLLPVVALVGSPYLASLLLSFGLTGVVIALLVVAARGRPWALAWGLAVLVFSKAFVDYSTSGLENPLSHALLAGLLVATASGGSAKGRMPNAESRNATASSRRRRILLSGLLVGLIGLSRMDLLLLAGPIALAALASSVIRDPTSSIRHSAVSIRHSASGIRETAFGIRWSPAAGPWPLIRASMPHSALFLLGLTPLAAWTFFSLAYYGLPFPNTAYAKLSTGVPQEMLTTQGFRYLGESWTRDPLTLPVIAAAALAPLAVMLVRAIGVWTRPRRDGRRDLGLEAWFPSWPVSLGLLFYIAYVVRIGGDFMSGRFLAAPVLVSVFALQRLPWPPRALPGLALVLVAAGLGLSAREPSVALLTGSSTLELADIWLPHGVVDERAFYFDRTGFLTRDGLRTAPRQDDLRPLVDDLRNQHPRTIVFQTVGMAGYYVGPDRHIIDTLALCDPLLARLPAIPPWRIGHYQRPIPEGYFESVDTDSNRIEDPEVAALYARIRLATRGPLWTRQRWKAILEVNLKP